jgi:hypothetical protein
MVSRKLVKIVGIFVEIEYIKNRRVIYWLKRIGPLYWVPAIPAKKLCRFHYTHLFNAVISATSHSKTVTQAVLNEFPMVFFIVCYFMILNTPPVVLLTVI